MTPLYVMTTRALRDGAFSSEPGPTRYLRVPRERARPEPADAIPAKAWFDEVRQAAVWGQDARCSDRERGDVLFFVHGYHNPPEIVFQRTRQLAADLEAVGFKGTVVAFDWPAGEMALGYLEDRHDAKRVAMQLVSDGIRALAKLQRPDCTINVHLLGHSTGAYLIREAFDDADDARLANSGWTVSQVVFIGADISASSLAAGHATSESLYRHGVRLTNYSNLGDAVLKLSNVKRLGLAPRAGRVGLPDDAPAKAVNVDCSDYFAQLERDPAVRDADQAAALGRFDHSWHIGNRVFTRDLFETLKGDLDRQLIPTRTEINGRLHLARG